MIAGLLHVFVGISRRAGLRQTQRTGELVTYLTDALNSIKPLKAMARQDGFARLFDRKIRSLRKALLRQVLSKEARRALERMIARSARLLSPRGRLYMVGPHTLGLAERLDEHFRRVDARG